MTSDYVGLGRMGKMVESLRRLFPAKEIDEAMISHCDWQPDYIDVYWPCDDGNGFAIAGFYKIHNLSLMLDRLFPEMSIRSTMVFEVEWAEVYIPKYWSKEMR